MVASQSGILSVHTTLRTSFTDLDFMSKCASLSVAENICNKHIKFTVIHVLLILIKGGYFFSVPAVPVATQKLCDTGARPNARVLMESETNYDYP